MRQEPERKAELRVCDGPVCRGTTQLFVYRETTELDGDLNYLYDCTGCQNRSAGNTSKPAALVTEDMDGNVIRRSTF